MSPGRRVPLRKRPGRWLRGRREAGHGRREHRARGKDAKRARDGPDSRRRRKRTLLALAALAVVALIVYALLPAPVPVDANVVQRGPLRVTVDEEGRTRAMNRVVVSAPITGRVDRIGLEEGDVVAAGGVVARMVPAPLDPRERAQAEARALAAESARGEAEAATAQAAAALAQAQRDLGRAERLTAAGAMAAQDLEAARLAVQTRRAELDAARARAQVLAFDAAAARAVLTGEPVAVRSPAGGRVLDVLEEGPRVVTAGTPLLEVGDPAALELVVDVLSEDAVLIRAGDPILVTEWGGPRTLAARVRRVEPAAFTVVSALGVEEQRVNVIGDLLDTAPELGDGYRFQARIVVWERADVLKVPLAALFRVGGRWHVFVIENGRARLRPVSIGQRSDAEAQVLDGLVAGEVVILRPDDELEDGTRVEPAE